MRKDAHEKETSISLSRWWWPGQWLHIMYGVWVNQVWYWRNIRPRLGDQKQRWGILVQGILGTVLIVLFSSLVLKGILMTIGASVDWDILLRRALLITGGVFGAAILMTLNATKATSSLGLGIAVIWGPIGSIAMMVLSAIAGMVTGVPLRIIIDLAVGLVIGVTGGMFIGVVMGNRFGAITSLIVAVCMCVPFSVREGIVNGIVGGTTLGLGLYFGGYWATRQVPDTETRKHLANPDRYRSESQ